MTEMHEPVNNWEDEEPYNRDGTGRELEWHPLDVEKGYDCRFLENGNCVVRTRDGVETELTPEEFDQFRAEGPNPKELP